MAPRRCGGWPRTAAKPSTGSPDLARDQQPKLTPAGRSLLEATYRGRVSYRTVEQMVIRRQGREFEDVSSDFLDLSLAGFAYVEPFDLDQNPPPREVPCLVTPAGEDALIEAHQAQQRKAKKR
jgi:hypothetical protein